MSKQEAKASIEDMKQYNDIMKLTCSNMDCKAEPTHMVWFLGVGTSYCEKHSRTYAIDKDFKVIKKQDISKED